MIEYCLLILLIWACPPFRRACPSRKGRAGLSAKSFVPLRFTKGYRLNPSRGFHNEIIFLQTVRSSGAFYSFQFIIYSTPFPWGRAGDGITFAPLNNFPSAETINCSSAANPDKTSTLSPNVFPVLNHLKMATFSFPIA